MTIKSRTALWIVAIVSLLMLVLCTFVYLEFERSEQRIFQKRLKEKATNTVKLLDQVVEVDSALLKLIDKNTIDQIRDEKVWVFDSLNRHVYSSLDDIQWQPRIGLLDSIRKFQYLVFKIDTHEAVGLIYNLQGKNRLVIAAGKDQDGIDSLVALQGILILGVLTSIILVALCSYFLAKQVLKPLVLLNKEVELVNDEQLHNRIQIQESNSKDEIKELAISFNKMLQRLQDAFVQQKQFIQYASHELRTPLAAVTNQIDLALQQDRSSEYNKNLLLSLQEEHDRLSKLLQQLLQLFRSGQAIQLQNIEQIFYNELIDECMLQISLAYPQSKLVLNFGNIPDQENDMILYGNSSLLSTALISLLENACKYGSGFPVLLEIGFDQGQIKLDIKNKGQLIPELDRNHLFSPFFRSTNTIGKRGFGLGLALAFKITLLHQGQLFYTVVDGFNCFSWVLPKLNPLESSKYPQS